VAAELSILSELIRFTPLIENRTVPPTSCKRGLSTCALRDSRIDPMQLPKTRCTKMLHRKVFSAPPQVFLHNFQAIIWLKL
jgi:hypothetical protein